MVRTDIFTLIQNKYKNFTKSEKKVADYIFQYPERILYTSITDFAEACNVGDTTVFRFCKALNLKGYQDFKMLLAKDLALKEGTESPVVGSISQGDDVKIVCEKTLVANIAALNETYGLLDFKMIEKVVDMIATAKRIHFFGMGSSGITALEAKQKFMRILPNVDYIQDCHMQFMAASLLDSQDLAILFSYSGATKDTIEIQNIAKKNGCPTVCITRYAKSVLASKSDVVLLCGSNEGPLDGGALATTVVQLYLLDILYLLYFIKHYNVSSENKAKSTEAISNKLL